MKRLTARRRRVCPQIMLLLTVLAIVAVLSIPPLYARYAQGDNAEDSANVASFLVSEIISHGGSTTYTVEETLNPGDTSDFTVTLANDSEVTVLYTITAQNLTGNLPLTFSVINTGGGSSATPTLNATENGATATVTLHPNEEASFTFRMSWDLSLPENLNPSYGGKTDLVQFDFVLEQED